MHVWNEQKLPTIELARERILPHAPAVPTTLAKKPVADAAAATQPVAEPGGGVVVPTVDPFADTDRDWSQDEIIEVLEPANNTWYDDIDSVSPVLPPPHER